MNFIILEIVLFGSLLLLAVLESRVNDQVYTFFLCTTMLHFL